MEEIASKKGRRVALEWAPLIAISIMFIISYSTFLYSIVNNSVN